MELVKQKRVQFCDTFYFWRNFFEHLWFISIYNGLNEDSKYLHFYISKNITSYTFLLVFKRVFLKPLTNRPPTTNHLLIEQPITYLRPPTNRPPSKCTDHRPTNHLPIRNMTTRNSIINFRWISDKNDKRSCYKYNIENVSNFFRIKTGMCHWKDKKIIKCEIN